MDEDDDDISPTLRQFMELEKSSLKDRKTNGVVEDSDDNLKVICWHLRTPLLLSLVSITLWILWKKSK